MNIIKRAVVKKAVELIENRFVKEKGRKTKVFVEKLSWESITDEFERILKDTIQGE